ncbi:MAG: hypothetical protein ABIT16_05110 [Croceibacterium sp.]
MRKFASAAWTLLLVATAASAQSDPAPETPPPLTAEKIIEVARDAYRPAGVWHPCPVATGNEIVVCTHGEDAFRVESPTDEAQRTGQPGQDSIPRAPNVDGPGIFQGKGIKMGKDPEPALIVDLTHVPPPLDDETARLVYRVEDGPPPRPTPVP